VRDWLPDVDSSHNQGQRLTHRLVESSSPAGPRQSWHVRTSLGIVPEQDGRRESSRRGGRIGAGWDPRGLTRVPLRADALRPMSEPVRSESRTGAAGARAFPRRKGTVRALDRRHEHEAAAGRLSVGEPLGWRAGAPTNRLSVRGGWIVLARTGKAVQGLHEARTGSARHGDHGIGREASRREGIDESNGALGVIARSGMG
jgi:hypothetical protein